MLVAERKLFNDVVKVGYVCSLEYTPGHTRVSPRTINMWYPRIPE